MNQRIVQVDAFTDRPFAGNPAAVCVLAAPRDAGWMQQVANEMNVAETAFLTRSRSSETRLETPSLGNNDYDLRWFSPTVEVDLCGHATLASAHVLWEEEILEQDEMARFHTRSGLLMAVHKENFIEMDFPAEPAEPVAVADLPPDLIAALGVRPLYIGKNRMDYLLEVEDAQTLRALKPDFGKLRRIAARGFIVTSRSDNKSGDSKSSDSKSSDNGSNESDSAKASPRFDFVSRFFAPAVGVDEDPATGSAHCCLGPYWQSKLAKTEFTAYQASARGGIVKVRVEGNRVKLGGQAITVLRGELADIAS